MLDATNSYCKGLTIEIKCTECQGRWTKPKQNCPKSAFPPGENVCHACVLNSCFDFRFYFKYIQLNVILRFIIKGHEKSSLPPQKRSLSSSKQLYVLLLSYFTFLGFHRSILIQIITGPGVFFIYCFIPLLHKFCIKASPRFFFFF